MLQEHVQLSNCHNANVVCRCVAIAIAVATAVGVAATSAAAAAAAAGVVDAVRFIPSLKYHQHTICNAMKGKVLKSS